MKHIVEVDLSGRIEVTKTDTALAYANGLHKSILIPASVKRICILEARRNGIIGPTLYNQFFAISLFLLLKEDINKFSTITLDYEYVGREQKIRDYLINILRRRKYTISYDQIHFSHIGKKSPAHELAIATLRGIEKPNKVIKSEEILREFKSK